MAQALVWNAPIPCSGNMIFLKEGEKIHNAKLLYTQGIVILKGKSKADFDIDGPVQWGTVQCSLLNYMAVQYSVVQCRMVQCRAPNSVQCTSWHCNTVQWRLCWNRCYFPQTLRDSVSPICGIFLKDLKRFIIKLQI